MSKAKSRVGDALKRGTIRFFYGPQPKQAPTTPARVEAVPPQPRSRVNDADVYAALAPERLNAEWDRTQPMSRLTPVQRRQVIESQVHVTPVGAAAMRRARYEGSTPAWAMELLNGYDVQMARPIAEMRRFVAFCQGRLQRLHEWETTGYLKRHRDAMANTGEVARRFLSGDPNGAKELIMAGARHAGSGIALAVHSVPSEVEQDPMA